MRFALPILALALLSPAVQAQEEDEIYVCRDANGEIVSMQVDPCPELPKARPPIKAAPRPKPKPKPKARAAKPPKPKPKPTARRTVTEWQRIQPLPARRQVTRRHLARQSFPTRLNNPHTPDFSTPERTWRSFLAAAHSNDHAAAADCLTPKALASLVQETDQLPLTDLQRMLATFTRIENEGEVGPFWAIQGVRTGARPKWILFEETKAGVWKIAGL